MSGGAGQSGTPGFRLQLGLLFLSMALVLGAAIFGFMSYQQHQLLQANLQSQAGVVARLAAQDIARIVYLDDPDVASDVAARLSNIPEIHSAIFYDTRGRLLLRLPNKGPTPRHSVTLNVPVKLDEIELGNALLTFFSPRLDAEQRRAQNLFFGFVGLVLLAGLLFAQYLDRHFLARLAELSRALQRAATRGDFAQRLRVDRDDEIGRARAHFNALLELVEAQTTELRHKASHDGLTGLYNRTRLLQELDRLLEVPPAKGYHAVCYLDLDRFKVINDTCGHAAGDQLLRELSRSLLEQVRRLPGALIGRLGGDEFLVLVRDHPAQDIARFLNDILRAVDRYEFRYMEREFPIGVSIGCILLKDERATPTEVISAADGACYQAKSLRHGGLVTHRLDAPEIRRHQVRMDWVSRLNTALEQDHFCLYLQPIVDAGRAPGPMHYEVLLRLREGGTLIGPDQFIPVAERFGLSPRIDRWVLERLFDTLYQAPEFMRRVGRISVNLSALTVADPHNRHAIDLLLKAFPLAPSRLCFEITETAVISELEQARRFMRHFRERGVRFAMDDFGTGMASFGYLKDLEFDILKIDGSFVRPIATDEVVREMARALVRIGRITGKEIVAEQVEDETTAGLLREMGVDYLQGWLFARPRPIAEVIAEAVEVGQSGPPKQLGRPRSRSG